jgi:threonine-phosphate decarboxylase
MRVPKPVARPAHGGDLDAIAKRYGVDAATLLDFSSNVDPFGPPSRVYSALYEMARSKMNSLARYPEPTSRSLRELFAGRLGIDPACIVIANGSAALFDAVVRAVTPAATVVPVPAFSEYLRAVQSAGSRYVPYPMDDRFDWDDAALLETIERKGATLLILTNPHNPSGRLFSQERLRALAVGCARLGAFVLLDEAFIDYAEEESLARDVPENAVVVRSLTKFYGIAGVRIGYAVAPEALATAVASRLPSWPVGAFDQAAAAAALTQHGYAERTLRRNERERSRMERQLTRAGMTVFPSAANFLLLELPCQAAALDELLERLIRESGIVVRDCRSYDGLSDRSVIRVAVRKQDESTRLIRALASLVSGMRPVAQF